jgi:hypothetical protein
VTTELEQPCSACGERLAFCRHLAAERCRDVRGGGVPQGPFPRRLRGRPVGATPPPQGVGGSIIGHVFLLEGAVMASRPRPVEHTLSGAVAETVGALDLGPEDAAAVRLAAAYATAVDALDDDRLPGLIGTIGPSLLRCLEQLGATPKARAEVGLRVDRGRSGRLTELDRLREARRGR